MSGRPRQKWIAGRDVSFSGVVRLYRKRLRVDELRRGSDRNDTRAEDLEEEPPTWEGKHAAS